MTVCLKTHREATVAGTGDPGDAGLGEHRARTSDWNHRGWASVSSWADLLPHGWPETAPLAVNLCSPFFFPKDLEGVPPSKKLKLEASQQNSEEM